MFNFLNQYLQQMRYVQHISKPFIYMVAQAQNKKQNRKITLYVLRTINTNLTLH